jgi:acyl carrier protein
MTADDIPAWDSITHIQLIFAVEEEFGINLSMKDLESLDDVGALRAAIARHLERAAG